MKQTVNKSDFHGAFRDCGRLDQFSYGARDMLFDFLEEMEQDTGEEYELNVIGLCCDFYEDDWQSIADNYSIDLSDCGDGDEREQAVIDYLQDNTMYIGQTSGSLIYQAF